VAQAGRPGARRGSGVGETWRSTKEGEGMPRVTLNQIAPDFNLPDYTGRTFRLSELRGKKNVLLVFNRGFV
jgi:hypothetical protein